MRTEEEIRERITDYEILSKQEHRIGHYDEASTLIYLASVLKWVLEEGDD